MPNTATSPERNDKKLTVPRKHYNAPQRRFFTERHKSETAKQLYNKPMSCINKHSNLSCMILLYHIEQKINYFVLFFLFHKLIKLIELGGREDCMSGSYLCLRNIKDAVYSVYTVV